MANTIVDNDDIAKARNNVVMVGSREQIKLLEREANQEKAESQYKLALIYEKNANYRKAAFWYKKAALNSLDIAQDCLAKFYYLGYGLKQNSQKAAYWYKKAAKQGYSYSQLTLAKLYRDGDGVAQNSQKSIYWYEQAANQNEIEAQYELALMYDQGDIVAKDRNKALYWYQKAATLGHNVAEERLSQLNKILNNEANNADDTIEFSNNLEAKYKINFDFQARLFLTPSDQIREFIIEQDSKKLQQLMSNINESNLHKDIEDYDKDDLNKHSKFIIAHAHKGNAFAQFALAQMYENGYLVAKDFVKAFIWYEKSALKGYSEAQFHLALIYDKGMGIEQDLSQAIFWYEKACEQSNDKAMYNLANMYFIGRGCDKDVEKALSLYEHAANKGNQKAQAKLAIIYDKGDGVAQDHKKAKYWYELSVSDPNSKNADPILSVAFMALYDKKVELNYKKVTAVLKTINGNDIETIDHCDIIAPKNNDLNKSIDTNKESDHDMLYTEYSNDFNTDKNRNNPKDLSEAIALNFKNYQQIAQDNHIDGQYYTEFSMDISSENNTKTKITTEDNISQAKNSTESIIDLANGEHDYMAHQNLINVMIQDSKYQWQKIKDSTECEHNIDSNQNLINHNLQTKAIDKNGKSIIKKIITKLFKNKQKTIK